MASETEARVESVIPILRVRDIQASVAYYRDALGFAKLWGAEPPYADFCAVGRDGSEIMLCEGGQGCSGTWLFVRVEDVTALHGAFQAGGAKIVHPPTNFSWGYEMSVEDPDGHTLRFASVHRDDIPFADR
jgi:predicted enzyme related to lactoylglutathione lyase